MSQSTTHTSSSNVSWSPLARPSNFALHSCTNWQRKKFPIHHSNRQRDSKYPPRYILPTPLLFLPINVTAQCAVAVRRFVSPPNIIVPLVTCMFVRFLAMIIIVKTISSCTIPYSRIAFAFRSVEIHRVEDTGHIYLPAGWKGLNCPF